MAVQRIDHVELDRPAERKQGIINLLEADWIHPVGAERDEQRPDRDGFERPQRSATVLPGQIEVRKGREVYR